MFVLAVDPSRSAPIHDQIVGQVRRAIEKKTLRPGERLPSTRRAAGQLGVHRSTVAAAYQELWSLGFIDLRPATRAIVRERMEIVSAGEPAARALVRWDEAGSSRSRKLAETSRAFPPRPPASLINFGSLDIDRRLFPLEPFRACLNAAVRRHGAALFQYGDPAGFAPLRESIAARLRSHGASISADEVLITNGSQQAIDLVFRMMAEPGMAVAVESPTYDYLLPLLQFHGLRPVEIPLRRDGMDLDMLERALRTKDLALVYTMPNFQNPTGVTTGQAHRERLLALCEEHRVPIFEDGFEEEMKYFGRVVLPIKSMDRHRLVMYSGTLSKVLSPGVRIGWLAADRDCIERLVAIRRFTELSPNMILQAAVHEFQERGHLDRHIARMHRAFRKRMQTAVRALRRHIAPEWAEWNEPDGGFLIWMTLKRPRHEPSDWARFFAARGIHVSLGRYFSFSRTSERSIRVSISTLDEPEISEGVHRLATALQRLHSRRGPS